jgi:hypothetical protein
MKKKSFQEVLNDHYTVFEGTLKGVKQGKINFQLVFRSEKIVGTKYVNVR